MNFVRKTLAIAAIAACVSAPAYAGYPDEAAGKFGRGLSNAALGWTEFFKNIHNETVQKGPLYFPVGLFKGVAYTVGRTVTGGIDVASFLIPSASFVQPAQVWDSVGTETSFGQK